MIIVMIRKKLNTYVVYEIPSNIHEKYPYDLLQIPENLSESLGADEILSNNAQTVVLIFKKKDKSVVLNFKMNSSLQLCFGA